MYTSHKALLGTEGTRTERQQDIIELKWTQLSPQLYMCVFCALSNWSPLTMKVTHVQYTMKVTHVHNVHATVVSGFQVPFAMRTLQSLT